MNYSLYFLFVITAITTVATPGPGVLMTLLKSIQHGYRGAVWTILGTASGTVVMACISATGLGILLAHSPQAYQAVQCLGGVYMIWLGIKSWRTKPFSFKLALKEDGSLQQRQVIIRRFPFYLEGVTLQMTNPMLIMFFISLFPQFIDQKLLFAPQFAVMTMTYFVLVFAIHTGYSIVTSHFRELLAGERASRLIYRIGGTVFIALAVKVLSGMFL